MNSDLEKLSKATKELRQALGYTQQEFAAKIQTSLRTVSRLEKDQLPKGRILLQLAQLAERHDLQSIASVFRAELDRELGSPLGFPWGEWTAWREGFQLLFRHRSRRRDEWIEIAQKIVQFVKSVAQDHEQVGARADDLRKLSEELAEFEKQFED